MFDAKKPPRTVTSIALALFALVATPAATALGFDEGKVDPCAIEENGYSGSLRIDFLLWSGPSLPQPTLVLVASDAEFAQLAEKLLCRKNASGLVLVEDMELEVQLRLVRGGQRMVGYLPTTNQRVHVVRRKDARKYY